MHKTNDGKGTQTYTYSVTTGLLTELVDSSHEGMKFTGAYDVEGNMLSEGYPNGMSATYTYNAAGKPTAVVYKRRRIARKKQKCVVQRCRRAVDSRPVARTDQRAFAPGVLIRRRRTADPGAENTPTASKDCTMRLYSMKPTATGPVSRPVNPVRKNVQPKAAWNKNIPTTPRIASRTLGPNTTNSATSWHCLRKMLEEQKRPKN